MREYMLTALIVAAITYLTTPLVRRFAERIGAYTEVRDRDVHTIPTPRLGGIAMFAGISAGFLVASHLPTLQRRGHIDHLGTLAGQHFTQLGERGL